MKMVLLVRQDLNMGAGKVAAQCCHATLGVYRKAVRAVGEAMGVGREGCAVDPMVLQQWEGSGEAKIVLKVRNGGQLQTLKEAAAALGLPHYAVTDAGRTQVAPGTVTVMAVGPADVDAIDQLTGHLKLL